MADIKKIKRGLHNWWEGREEKAVSSPGDAVASPTASASCQEAPSPPSALRRDGKPLWDATRLEVAQVMWGSGFLTPGAQAFHQWLPEIWEISGDDSLASLTTEIGEGVSLLVRQKKPWIDAFEASPFLAQEARLNLARQQNIRTMPVQVFDPDAPALQKSYNGAFAHMLFSRVRDPLTLWRHLQGKLKKYGQVAVLDFGVKTLAILEKLKPFEAMEPQTLKLMVADKMPAMVKDCGYKGVDLQDVSDAVTGEITAGLTRLNAHISKHTLPESTRKAIAEEVSLWGMRLKAMDAGLRVYRCNVLK